MILPTKGISSDRALLTVGAEILDLLDEPKTVSRLWAEMAKKSKCSRLTFDWFILALDLLFLMGLVALERGRLSRIQLSGEAA